MPKICIKYIKFWPGAPDEGEQEDEGHQQTGRESQTKHTVVVAKFWAFKVLAKSWSSEIILHKSDQLRFYTK